MNKTSLIFLLALLSIATSVHAERHYGIGYNFCVTIDSVAVQREDPIIAIDSLPSMHLIRGQEFAVARLQVIPSDSTGTIWVQIGTCSLADSASIPSVEMVWIPEHEMLASAVPNNAVSRVIHGIAIRSDLIFTVFLGLLVFLILARYLQRHPAEGSQPQTSIQIMLADRIDSYYPILLTICVVVSTLTILFISPDHWTAFYFHPTLNPFAYSYTPIAICLALLWFTLTVLIATLSEVFTHLPSRQALTYTLSIPSFLTFLVWLLLRLF
ncbi:MAG: hypothetical protein HUK00_03635 [Bacteroidaceae bacterium]|nr:hypothetical protein [Bacteroidaceae bacterium]